MSRTSALKDLQRLREKLQRVNNRRVVTKAEMFAHLYSDERLYK